jgi:hypothetical protein
MLRKLVLLLVIAVLTCAPFAVDKAEAVDACDLAFSAPSWAQPALVGLCFAILIANNPYGDAGDLWPV